MKRKSDWKMKLALSRVIPSDLYQNLKVSDSELIDCLLTFNRTKISNILNCKDKKIIDYIILEFINNFYNSIINYNTKILNTAIISTAQTIDIISNVSIKARLIKDKKLEKLSTEIIKKNKLLKTSARTLETDQNNHIRLRRKIEDTKKIENALNASIKQLQFDLDKIQNDTIRPIDVGDRNIKILGR